MLWAAAYVHPSFSWNFRFASLLLVGIWLIIGAALCVAAAGPVLRGRSPDWRRAVSGIFVLLLVAAPLIPVQPELAGMVVVAAMADLVAITSLLVWFSFRRSRLGRQQG